MLDETNDWPVGAVSVKAIDKPSANAELSRVTENVPWNKRYSKANKDEKA